MEYNSAFKDLNGYQVPLAGVAWPWSEGGHSSSPSADVKHTWSFTSTAKLSPWPAEKPACLLSVHVTYNYNYFNSYVRLFPYKT